MEWIGAFSVPEKEAQQGQSRASRARVARSRISREGQSLSLALTEASVSCYRRALQLRTLCAIFSFTSVQWPQVNFLRIRIPSISFQILENNSKERNEYF